MAHENVRLVQVDGKLPNLALMKLAHWHKSIGNRVTLSHTVQPSLFEQVTYHRVYGSAIFTRSRDKLDELLTAYPSRVPGSGVRVRRCSQKLTTASSLMATRTQPRRTTVVKHSMDLLELLRKRGIDGEVDFLREALRVLVDGIMDAEVSAQIGAQHGERSPERVTYRNGYRNRTWDTRVGTMELHIPKLREGSYFPSLLEPRRRSEKALLSVIQQAYPSAGSGQAWRESPPEGWMT